MIDLIKKLKLNSRNFLMVDSKAGVGSIWNKGNWHWEDRNYTEFAKEYLKKQFITV